jgi:hypothetical protein
MVQATRAGRLQGAGTSHAPSPGMTPGQRSVALLFQLNPFFPLNLYVLVPRNFDEAHKQSDSLCIMLGLPFSVLGPLLYSASVLKSKKGSFTYCDIGYNVLHSTYKTCDLKVSIVQTTGGKRLYYFIWGQGGPKKPVLLPAGDKILPLKELRIDEKMMNKIKKLSLEIVRTLSQADKANFFRSY